jgi:hypothetical protein
LLLKPTGLAFGAVLGGCGTLSRSE